MGFQGSKYPEPFRIEELFRLWYRPLCLFAMHYLEDIGQSEDIVQECYMSLWEHYGSVSPQSVKNPKSYLYTMVRNRCLDVIRRNGRRGEHVSLDSATNLNHEAMTVTESFHEDKSWQEDSVREARLWTAIDSLPVKCREIFLLSKKEGLKYSEIAKRLGISENTVRNQVSKALKLLKEEVSRFIYFLFGL